MSFVVEISLMEQGFANAAAQSWFEAATATWQGLHGLVAIDCYRPAAGRPQDPYNDDGRGPAIQALLHFADEEPLHAALADAAFCDHLRRLPDGVAATFAAFSRSFYGPNGPLPDQAMTAAFSYVVRYHRAAENEAAFLSAYVAGHPPHLATLPAIKAVLCYFPLPGITRPDGIAQADYLIGNETAFDTIEAFNAAMASPVRHELRSHFRELPPFTGRNTHYAMDRTRLAG